MLSRADRTSSRFLDVSEVKQEGSEYNTDNSVRTSKDDGKCTNGLKLRSLEEMRDREKREEKNTAVEDSATRCSWTQSGLIGCFE